MNIKALALTTLLALGSATPALAYTPAYPGDNGGGGNQFLNQNNQVSHQTCYFSTNMNNDYFTEAETYRCTVTTRKNVNGHWVWDVQAGDLKTTVVLWNDGMVEFWQDGVRYTGRHQEFLNDQTIVYTDGSDYHFAF